MSVSDSKMLSIEQLDDCSVMTIELEHVDAQLLTRIERESTSISARGVKRPIILEMNRVDVLPSVMMGALLALLRKLKDRGLHVIIVGLNEQIRGTLKLTHLDKMFEVLDNMEEARSALRKHARL